MKTITMQRLQEAQRELDEKASDTRAMLTAIEALICEGRSPNIMKVCIANGAGDAFNDVHCLITMALERASTIVDLSGQIESILLHARHRKVATKHGMQLRGDSVANKSI